MSAREEIGEIREDVRCVAIDLMNAAAKLERLARALDSMAPRPEWLVNAVVLASTLTAAPERLRAIGERLEAVDAELDRQHGLTGVPMSVGVKFRVVLEPEPGDLAVDPTGGACGVVIRFAWNEEIEPVATVQTLEGLRQGNQWRYFRVARAPRPDGEAER